MRYFTGRLATGRVGPIGGRVACDHRASAAHAAVPQKDF
jgi:hypothetical protein